MVFEGVLAGIIDELITGAGPEQSHSEARRAEARTFIALANELFLELMGDKKAFDASQYKPLTQVIAPYLRLLSREELSALSSNPSMAKVDISTLPYDLRFDVLTTGFALIPTVGTNDHRWNVLASNGHQLGVRARDFQRLVDTYWT